MVIHSYIKCFWLFFFSTYFKQRKVYIFFQHFQKVIKYKLIIINALIYTSIKYRLEINRFDFKETYFL